MKPSSAYSLFYSAHSAFRAFAADRTPSAGRGRQCETATGVPLSVVLLLPSCE